MTNTSTHNASEVGTLLRETREGQGLTLAGVTYETRIPKNILEALEVDGRVRGMGEAYSRSYLKLYAEFLGLEVDGLPEGESAVGVDGGDGEKAVLAKHADRFLDFPEEGGEDCEAEAYKYVMADVPRSLGFSGVLATVVAGAILVGAYFGYQGLDRQLVEDEAEAPAAVVFLDPEIVDEGPLPAMVEAEAERIAEVEVVAAIKVPREVAMTTFPVAAIFESTPPRAVIVEE